MVSDKRRKQFEETMRKSSQSVASNFIRRSPISAPVEISSIEVSQIENQSMLIIFEMGQASISILQRKLGMRYSQAAHIMDSLEKKGIVGPFDGSKPRTVLITKEQYLKRLRIVDKPFPSMTKQPEIDFDKIIKEEREWRREQQGLSLVEYELQQIDRMDGWAAI